MPPKRWTSERIATLEAAASAVDDSAAESAASL